MKKFLDSNGNVLMVDSGDPDPIKCAEIFGFPSGWQAVDINEQELAAFYADEEQKSNRVYTYFPKTDREHIEQLLTKHNALIEVLEEELKMKKGDLAQKVKDKIEGVL